MSMAAYDWATYEALQNLSLLNHIEHVPWDDKREPDLLVADISPHI
jgi:hypothetical protein